MMMPSGGGMAAGKGMIKTLLLNEAQFIKIAEYPDMHRLSPHKNS
jgi:hypothetical protein